jgi:hypothetical protein
VGDGLLGDRLDRRGDDHSAAVGEVTTGSDALEDAA